MPDVDLNTQLTGVDRAALLTQLNGAADYQARLEIIRNFPGLSAYRTADEAQLRMIALNLLLHDNMNSRSYTGMQNYLRLFAPAANDQPDDAARLNGYLANEMTALRVAHTSTDHNTNWGDVAPSYGAFFTSTTPITASTVQTLLTDNPGFVATSVPITTPLVPPRPLPVIPADDILNAQREAHAAGVPVAAINNPLHSYWRNNMANDTLFYNRLFPSRAATRPAENDDDYVDPTVTPFVAPTVVVTTPVVTTPVVTPTTGISGNVPLTSPIAPSAPQYIQVNAIGTITMEYALPEASRYTGSAAQINQAMFRDMESAYGILINVAGRGSTSNPARPQVGLTQQNLMALYTTLNSFDPNNPNANRGVIEGELRSLGFSPTEISRLLGNPALAQMMARVAYASSSDVQFGAIRALQSDDPSGATTAVITAGDLRALQTETHLLANGATDEGTGGSGIVTLDPQAPTIARHGHAFMRARILSSAILFNPANRDEMVGAVATATFANWEAFRTPATNLTGLLRGAMDPSRPGGNLTSFGTAQAVTLQTLLAPGAEPENFEALCASLKLSPESIRTIRSNANNRTAAYATATWMVSSLQRGELQGLNVPTTGTNAPDATFEDIVALDEVLRLPNPQNTVVLNPGSDRTRTNAAIAGLYGSVTTTSGVFITNRSSVPYITQTAPVILAASSGGAAPVYYSGPSSYGGHDVISSTSAFVSHNIGYGNDGYAAPMISSGSSYGFSSAYSSYSGYGSGYGDNFLSSSYNSIAFDTSGGSGYGNATFLAGDFGNSFSYSSTGYGHASLGY